MTQNVWIRCQKTQGISLKRNYSSPPRLLLPKIGMNLSKKQNLKIRPFSPITFCKLQSCTPFSVAKACRMLSLWAVWNNFWINTSEILGRSTLPKYSWYKLRLNIGFHATQLIVGFYPLCFPQTIQNYR